ncbi:hypothetical protein HYH03_015789 [Edaphochlamys debaryana]|uniref:Uncharacterized protein n=1 Tax=Edaphochlamys debaryana TaxID=47281 RepID=A0A836BQX9_9CHLO|nr:hypothetical protein HYH03_015789 [Edaphochlamys debaryana]|eukprot:KAG2485517.1 hypothetical protein HYH03_015789 [Edaphochlamys debaryana]
MPPRARGRGGGSGAGSGPAGSAAASPGSDAAAALASALPAPLRSAVAALPAAAEALLGPLRPGRGGGGGGAGGRGRGAGGGGRLAALREAKEQLSVLRRELERLPLYGRQDHLKATPAKTALAAALAELLARQAEAAALRPDGGAQWGGGGRGDPMQGWQSGAWGSVHAIVTCCGQLPVSYNAPSVLRFLLAMLRSGILHALSRRLAAADDNSTVEPFIRRALDTFLALTTCWGELARALAESGFLEHAARRVLQLEARRLQQATGTAVPLMWGLCRCIAPMAHVLDASSPSPSLVTWAWGPIPRVRGPAATHLRTVLGGRCVRTAVLVYGVGTLRLLDQNPCYGLPAALRIGGLPSYKPAGVEVPSSLAFGLLLHQLGDRLGPPPPGPATSLELALRVVQALMPAPAPTQFSANRAAGAKVPVAVSPPAAEAALLGAAALECGRRLLSRRWRRAPPRLADWRRRWWRLLVLSAREHGAGDDEDGGAVRGGDEGEDVDGEPVRQRLYELVTEPLLGEWPTGHLDLAALPPAPPPELAAALEAGLLPALTSFLGPAPAGCAALAGCLLRGLLGACDRARPEGSGVGLMLTALLAYGEEGQAEGLLGALGQSLQAERAGRGAKGAGGAGGEEPFRRAATSFPTAAAHAGQHCRSPGSPPGSAAAGAGPSTPARAAPAGGAAASGSGAGAAGEALEAPQQPSGPAAAPRPSSSAAPPPSAPLRQLGRMAGRAAELWGLPLGAPAGAGAERGGAAG